MFLFSSPHVSMHSTWLLWWNSQEQSSFLWRKHNTSNSELLLVLLLELRSLKRHVSTNKNIHLQKNTHSFTLQKRGGSAVWNVKNFLFFSRFQHRFVCSVKKNRLIKDFFPIMCRAMVYSSLFLCQFKLYFFGGIWEIITQFKD